MVDRGRGVFYRVGEKVESMDDAVALSDSGLVELFVHKLKGVRKNDCFREGIGEMEAAVVIECWLYVEALAAAEVPQFSGGGIVVDDDWTIHGTDGCDIEVEGNTLVFPGRHGRGNVGLEKEIQGELCLG